MKATNGDGDYDDDAAADYDDEDVGVVVQLLKLTSLGYCYSNAIQYDYSIE